MHLRKIGDGRRQVVEWVVKDDLAAVRHVEAKCILKCNFFFAGALFCIVRAARTRRIVVRAAVKYIAEHTVVIQSQARNKRAAVGLCLGKRGSGTDDRPQMLWSSHRQEDFR